MPQESDVAKIMAEAESLVANVSADLERSGQALRDMGIDPSEVVSAFEPYITPKQREEVARLIAQDQEDLQRKVDEGMARLRFDSKPSARTRKPRSMV